MEVVDHVILMVDIENEKFKKLAISLIIDIFGIVLPSVQILGKPILLGN